MRFNIKTLLFASAIFAVLIFLVDALSREVVTVEFEYAFRTTARAVKFQGVASDYTATFVVDDGGRSKLKGSVHGNFGYNEFFGEEIQEQNFRDIEEKKIDLHLRRRPFPWSPPESIGEQLQQHFVSISGEHSWDGRSIFDGSRYE